MRAKMSLAPHEDRQLFDEVERVLEADAFNDARRRLAGAPLPLGDADDDGGIGTPPAEGGDGGDGNDDGDGGDETPPYDPDHPQPGDPDDPDEPEEPERPKKPKPDCSDIRRELELVNGELDELNRQILSAEADLKEKVAEVERLREADGEDEFPSTDILDDMMRPEDPGTRTAVWLLNRLLRGSLRRLLGKSVPGTRKRMTIKKLEAEVEILKKEIEDLKRKLGDKEKIRSTLEKRLADCENR
ncbi:MAG: hypothetical protein CMM61_09745 [Rhodospirillaceae bacterium]|nr:hypothetical protein [Rhodospirillaceae bacterium]